MAHEDDKVLEDVCALLQSHNPNKIELTGTTRLDSDLNVDSVAAMDMIMEIEDRFDIDIPINYVSDVETLQDLVDLVQKRIGDG